MTNENALPNVDNIMDFAKFQEKLNREAIPSQFRKNLVGGLNEEDVTKYIVYMEDKGHQLENEIKKGLNEISNYRKKLKKEMEDKQSLQNNLDNYIAECKRKDIIMQSLDEKGCTEIERLQNELHKMEAERNEFEKSLSDSRPGIAQLQNEIYQLAEERKEMEKLLSDSSMEIERITEESARFKEENNVIHLKVADMEEQIMSKDIQAEEFNAIFQELEQQIEFERSRNEKQSEDLEILKQKIASLEATIAETTMEIEEQRKIGEKAEQELKLEKARVSSNEINGFKDEVIHIYKKNETLADEADQHVKIYNELQQQFYLEQERANKAETNMAELVKWISVLRDNLNSEQNLLETQFKQIVDRRNQFQSEINGCLMNSQEIYNISTIGE